MISLRNGHGFYTALVLSLVVLVSISAQAEEAVQSEELARALRADPNLYQELENEDFEKRAHLEPASFSRILRSSFSRILKRDPGFSRILKRSETSPSFSRILRNTFSRILRDPLERNMRAQQFSRILKRSNAPSLYSIDYDDMSRNGRSSSFSRILR